MPVPSSCDQHTVGEKQVLLNEQGKKNGDEVAIIRGTWLSALATAETVWHPVKWSEDSSEILKSVAGHFKSGRWVYVFFMLLKTCDWSLVGCHPVPGDLELNAFYTPLQNRMMSDLSAMANCPARGEKKGRGRNASVLVCNWGCAEKRGMHKCV